MRALINLVGARPATSSSSTDSQSSTSAVFPGLRKLDLPSDASQLQPLLTLTLSAPSFLDSVVKDDFSDTPLYIIETHKDRTGIFRCDSDNIHSVAKLQWPTTAKMASANAVALSGISVQMHGGRWRPTEDFMKFGSLFTSRKFHIPHHSHSLKWKRTGSSYTCVCSSIKGSVATLESAVLSAPPRLRIFSSLLRDADASRPQPNFGGVPLVVMDYLITTSLILVTDIEEWMHRPMDDVEAARSAMETFLPPTMRDWRKNRASYLSGSSGSHSPNSSLNNITANNYALGDDSRSINSEAPTTPSSASAHPYALFNSSDRDIIPPVPEVPIEHQSSLSPLTRSSTLGTQRRRKLPLPPGPYTPNQPRPDQPWLQNRPQSASEPSTSGSSELGSTTLQLQLVSPSTTPPPSEPSRSSGSINRRALPQQRPPPQLPVPLPPKLMNELNNTREVSQTPNSSMDTSSTEGESSTTSYLEIEHDQAQEPSQDISSITLNNTPGARETIYELPPPAYDAIDFSLPRQPVPDLPPSFQSFSLSHPEPPPELTESS